MAGMQRLEGIGVSPGFGYGPAFLGLRPEPRRVGEGAGLPEDLLLDQAISAAQAGLLELAAMVGPAGQNVLDFQIALLDDPEIRARAEQALAAGHSAASAWMQAMDEVMAGLAGEGSDAQSRARIVDLDDVRHRVLAELAGVPATDFREGSVFVGPDMHPSVFLAHDWSKGGGIVLSGGSVAGHVAMLARATGVPLVVAVAGLDVAAGAPLLADGQSGEVWIDPPRAMLSRLNPAGRPAKPPPGPALAPLPSIAGDALSLLVNINTAADLEAVDPAAIDGIGLVRTEFLLPLPGDILDEDRQVQLYRRCLVAGGSKPVTIRLFDFGGDKPLSYDVRGHGADAMGMRGVRLLLARPEVARVQLRALLRAGASGSLRILMPMVTAVSEVERLRDLLIEEADRLRAEGLDVVLPPLGIMVEVPAVALMLDAFTSADFFSIGSNDLTQFLAAANRTDARLSDLLASARPALLRLIGQAVSLARSIDRPISICGEMAGSPGEIASLLGAGLRQFSVAPSQVTAVRASLMASADDSQGRGG